VEKSITCECGNNKFWYFGNYIRCPKCFMEFKMDNPTKIIQRRWNKKLKQYNENWEGIESEG
jgi:hypothetical protein